MKTIKFKDAPKHQFAGDGERFDVNFCIPEEGREVYVWHRGWPDGPASSCGTAWYTCDGFMFSGMSTGITKCNHPVYWQYKLPYRTLEEDAANAAHCASLAKGVGLV